MEKDYSLLRPFDPEAAKRGEPICLYDGRELWDYVAGPDAKGRLCLSIKRTGAFADTFNCPASGFRMAPLCWVEGKPVYKGDVLYQYGDNRTFKINGYEEKSGGLGKPCLTYDNTREYVEKFTWTPPKVKREVNLLAYLTGENLVWKRCEAEVPDFYIRVPSEDKVIVVEE